MPDSIVDMETLLNDICSECVTSATPYENYSGHNMSGSKCWGIVTDDAIDCIEQAAIRGLLGAKIDSMGSVSIVYWPTPYFTDECLNSYGEDDED